MPPKSRSFECRSDRPERVVATALANAATVQQPCTGLIFLGGPLALQAPLVAKLLAQADSQTPWLIAGTVGVLTERAEIEREPGATGLIFETGRSRILLSSTLDAEFGEAIGRNLAGGARRCGLLLLAEEQRDDVWLQALHAESAGIELRLFGAGAHPRAGLFLVESTRVDKGVAAAVLIDGPIAYMAASTACRLISPLLPVTKTRGHLLLELGDEPALRVMTESTERLVDRQVVLVAMAGGPSPLSPGGRSLVLQPIRGVDPSRNGILLERDLPIGSSVGFAVRDANVARTDLSAHLLNLRRNCGGSMPSFGIYVNCSGRGRGLYDAPDVDVRLIRNEFPEMPLVGFQSAFEFAPQGGQLVEQVYTGVLGVFCRPS